MSVYNNPKDGSTLRQMPSIATNLHIINAPTEQFVTQSQFIEAINDKQDIIQYNTIPTASQALVGKIIQYVGTTNTNYTNGYFYKCVSNGGTPATYSWTQINVQSGGGSDGVTREELDNDYLQMHFIHDISEFDGAVNVKEYGAVGDGITDDSNAFISALNDSDTIWIPRGSYNLNHIDITLSEMKTIVGESRDFVTILNSNITAPYGISCENITFNGGTTRDLTSDTYKHINTYVKNAPIIINCTPYHESSINNINVSYINCIFQNAGNASLAYFSANAPITSSFDKNIIQNCIFQDLDNTAILHCLNINKVLCKNNIFKNIGVTTAQYINNTIFGVAFGDWSNTTSQQVNDCQIINNTFDNFVTYDDVYEQGTQHGGNRNMICCHGDKISVLYNTLKNLIGYGEDREGIYVKGNYVDIGFNYLENAGLGEAYICCKNSEMPPVSSKRNQYVHDNILVGETGCGIRVYGTGNIYRNHVSITNVKNAIYATSSSNKSITINNNYCDCGISPYFVNNEEYLNYRSQPSVIVCYQHNVIDMCDNIVIMHDNYTNNTQSSLNTASVIYVTSIENCCNLLRNQIFSDNYSRGITIYNSNPQTPSNLQTPKIHLVVSHNIVNIQPANIDNNKLTQPFYIRFKNTYPLNSIERYIEIIDNTILSTNYCAYGAHIEGNADSFNELKFDTQQPNVQWRYSSGTHLEIQYINQVSIPNQSWVTVKT